MTGFGLKGQSENWPERQQMNYEFSFPMKSLLSQFPKKLSLCILKRMRINLIIYFLLLIIYFLSERQHWVFFFFCATNTFVKWNYDESK